METFEEFKVFAREKYKEFDSDAEWLDYIYFYIDQYTLSCLPLIWMRILICWIQYNELRYRGFNDNVGEVEIREKTDRKDKNGKAIYDKKSLEADFIASLGSQKYYVQSALSITDEEKKMQKRRSLYYIDDSFKKIKVTKNGLKPALDEKGVLIIDLFDFLTKPETWL